MKLSIGLGVALLATLTAFVGYRQVMVSNIEKMQIELQVCTNNQAVLEKTISDQNETIKNQIANAKRTQDQITKLTNQYTSSQQQVANLRNKFAKHNLEGMALAKPALLEGKVNKASARVLQNLTTITNPEQFDEKATDNTASNN
jgi:uncharacterized coiled-coil protein SlyX